MIDTLRIGPDDLTGEAVLALLQLHLDEMHQWSPPESVHAMPADRLRRPDVAFFCAWDGDVLAGCGAIKHLDARHGELKSMRAAPAYRGRGVGRAILAHLLAEARRRGYARVSLETGRPEAFQPAQDLYRAHGFVECAPFGDYVANDFSICMTLALSADHPAIDAVAGRPVNAGMNLRPALAADAAPLARLGTDSFVAKFGHLYNPQDLASFLKDSHSEAKVAGEIANPGLRVMLAHDDDGNLLGFCKLVMECGWPDHARGGRVIELKQLYAAPEATGRGIGGALMDWAVAEAAAFGADEIQLSVYAENPGAQKFYARYGFEKVADIHFMVGEQRDEEFLFARVL